MLIFDTVAFVCSSTGQTFPVVFPGLHTLPEGFWSTPHRSLGMEPLLAVLPVRVGSLSCLKTQP